MLVDQIWLIGREDVDTLIYEENFHFRVLMNGVFSALCFYITKNLF